MKRAKYQAKQLRKKWNKLKKWQEENRFEITQSISDFETFKIAWQETKNELGPKNSNVMRQLKNNLKYPTKYGYRLKAYQSYKEYMTKLGEPKELNWKSWKQLTYREMAEYMKDDIKAFYKGLLDSGMNAKQAKREVSQYYFGS